VGAATEREVLMVDVVRVKPPAQMREQRFPKGRSSRIQVLQPEDELPL
jgi:hypothetical protein